MKYKGTTLTTEQAEAAKPISAGLSCRIIAPAGSGKTFSLLAGSRRRSGNGLNLSFNKAIADSASKKFATNITCRTGHSLAFQHVGKFYSRRLKKLTGATLAQNFDIGQTSIFGTPAFKGYNILETIRRFCYSNDLEIQPKHAPKLQINGNEELQDKLRANLSHFAAKVFEEMSSRSSNLPITHDFYLKKWAMEAKPLPYDFIIFDEAQDANPVMVDLIIKQKCQQVFAGDPFQQIYSWRGAVNALQTLPYDAFYLTKSFRFGQAIADVATKIIHSYLHPGHRMPAIKGNDDIESQVITTTHPYPDCIICRTNKTAIAEVIKHLDQNLKVFLMGGGEQMTKLINGICALQKGERAYHQDLMLFEDYDDLLEYASSPMGGDLAVVIKLIDSYGQGALNNALSSTTTTEEQADITITTCHKAKGLEWPVVRLANDFKYPVESEKMIPSEEANLLYVAATRALNVLDISNCQALSDKALERGQEYWRKVI